MARITEHMTRQAAAFIWLTGSTLDQRRLEHLLGAGDHDAILTALTAHRTPDGGYAYALEPDAKGPMPQPLTAMTALEILHETDTLAQDTAQPICDWLRHHTAPDRGVPDLLDTITDYPRPPWVEPPPQNQGGLLTTARCTGLLLRHGIEHDWVDDASTFCRNRIDALETTHPYEAFSIIRFLDNTPDHDWAASAAQRIGTLVRDGGLVLLDPANPEHQPTPPGYADDEHTHPCDYATEPDSLAAQWFTPDELAASLDHLAAAQREDGGWPLHYRRWNPAIEQQARPGFTLRALAILNAWDQT
jgi:hypothetical protein